MLRMELDHIQIQLKTAIQNHQILVSQLQLQPQETGLKTKLHNLQKEIIFMCKKQKLVVEKLGKDLIEKKPYTTPYTQTNLQVVTKQTSLCKNVVSDQVVMDDVMEPQVTQCVQSCVQPQCISDQTADQHHQSSDIKTNTSLPLRVPQYPVTKPPVLRNNNSITKDQSVILNRKSLSDRSSTLLEHNSVDLIKLEEQKLLKKKISFMASLDLVPPDTLKEVSCKRSERKRRSTNNPNFAYGFELEKRPRLSNYIASDYFGAKKSKAVNTSSPSSSTSTTLDHSSQHKNGKENIQEHYAQCVFAMCGQLPRCDTCSNIHDNLCSVCGMSGQLLRCDTCSSVQHLKCLTPPLETVPDGHWMCPKCQDAQRKAASLAAVYAYISNKNGKEEEKRKLLRRSTELLQEKQHIENRTKQLNEILAKQGIHKEELIQINRKAQKSVENLKKFKELVQLS